MIVHEAGRWTVESIMETMWSLWRRLRKGINTSNKEVQTHSFGCIWHTWVKGKTVDCARDVCGCGLSTSSWESLRWAMINSALGSCFEPLVVRDEARLLRSQISLLMWVISRDHISLLLKSVRCNHLLHIVKFVCSYSMLRGYQWLYICVRRTCCDALNYWLVLWGMVTMSSPSFSLQK